MEDIEDSPQKADIMRRLAAQMARLRASEDFGPGLLHKINSLIVWTRDACRREGIDFPVMVAVILPAVKTFALYRADLDDAQLDRIVVELFREHVGSGLTIQDIAIAMKEAYPDYARRRLETMAQQKSPA